MTNSRDNSDSSKLDAYLDGTLPEQERESMAREIGASAALQADVELQQRIDQSLQARFAAPGPPADLLAKLREQAAVSPMPESPPRRRLTLAIAAIAAALVWGVIGWQYFANRSPTRAYDPIMPLATIYKERVADGFHPTWVCSDDREFASTFATRQGQGLLLAAMPPGTKMEGLTYCGGISRYTTTMLARVDGSPVMVFVDRASEDIHPAPPPAETGLHLFRKELGPLVLYEVTPLDHASVMDYLYLADVPAAK